MRSGTAKENRIGRRYHVTCQLPRHKFGNGQEWLDIDEKFPTRLEDWISFSKPTRHIIRANFIVTMDYCPWYFPFRFYKSFGFKSAKGSDGQLYWRAYEPQSSDYLSDKNKLETEQSNMFNRIFQSLNDVLTAMTRSLPCALS